jgi:fumarate hydratase subunit alpha
MRICLDDITAAARHALIKAGTTFRRDQIAAYQRAIRKETNPNARWVLEQLLENARIAKNKKLPLCDDTGIPHVLVDIGSDIDLPAGWLHAVQSGVAQGLNQMPGRPMAVRGDGVQRIEQSAGLYRNSAKVALGPVIVRPVGKKRLILHVLLLGGGPEIRAQTRRVFHRRSLGHVLDEAASWICGEVGSLGCTPIVAAMGIGRTQTEAAALMLDAMAKGNLNRQSAWERRVTDRINQTLVGPLGLGGSTTALGTFIKIGPARASGVRIVSMRPCCCVEPRKAAVRLG